MTSSNVNTHFCKVKLQRRSIAMKLILYTCIVCPTQVLRCFSLDTITLILFFLLFFCCFFVSIHWYSTGANCKYVLWNRVPDLFFCICWYAHLETRVTRVKIYAYMILFFFPQYNLCIVPQQKYPQIPSQTTTTLPSPHYNTQLLYIMSICITRTHTHTQQNQNKEQKIRKRNYKQIFGKGCPFAFLQ